VTLSANADEMKDAPKVALMTVHAAKGLEFSAVFLTGMEEDTFPFRSQDPTRRNDIEEERRLAYVALTRAREKLWITHAERRMIFGATRYCAPSSFLADLPMDVIDHKTTESIRVGRYIDRESQAPQAPRLAWSHPQAAPSARRAYEPPVRTEREPGERYVERDEPEPFRGDGGLGVGDRVTNKAFGYGRVVAVDSGPDPTATVDFVGWGKKRVKARFLSPASS
jgi:DNA helicase-2/ATP-dependent DNA helicase PcrA